MHPLLEAGLSNAIAATLLASLVAIVTRVWRNPFAAHALWLIVLLKLVTPPVFHLPVSLVEGMAQGRPDQHPDQIDRIGEHKWAGQWSGIVPGHLDPQGSRRNLMRPHASTEQSSTSSSASANTLSMVREDDRPRPQRPLMSGTWPLALVWASGSVVWLSVGLSRIVRFECLVQRQSWPSDELRSLAAVLVERLGMPACPDVRVTDAAIGPLVWSGFRRPIVLVGSGLLRATSREQMTTILAHELTHIRRRDYWVRRVEMAAIVLYWWHPVAWYATRRLRDAEEACCDAAVVELTGSGVEYGTALLLAAEFAGGRRRMPVVASPFGRSPQLKRRVAMILEQHLPSRLSRGARVVLALSACAVLPLSVFGAQEEEKSAAATLEPSSTSDKSEPAGSTAEGEWRMAIRAVDEATGQPIAGPRIAVQLASGNDAAEWSEGNEAGQVEVSFISQLPRYCYLKCRAEGYVPMQAFWSNRDGEPPDELPEVFAFKMGKAITVGGTVVDEEGGPVAGARVLFSAGHHEPPSNRRQEQSFYNEELVTDSAGLWRCDLAPPEMNSASINVNHPEFALSTTTFSLDQDIEELKELSHRWVLRRGFTVRGRVTNEDGNPVTGATLAIGNLNLYSHRGPFVQTDAEGEYRIDRVAPVSRETPFHPERYRMTITAVKPGLAPVMHVIPGFYGTPFGDSTAKERIVNFTLTRGATVRLHIVDKEGNSQPGAYVFITEWRETDALAAFHHNGIPHRANPNGVWEWTWAPPDVVRYDVEQPGFMRARDIEVNASETSDVVVSLLAPQVITGTAVDAETGEPLKQFNVQKGFEDVHGHPGGLWWVGRVAEGENGEYRMTITIPPAGGTQGGTHRFRVLAEGYEPAISDSIPFDEGEVTVDFKLRRKK